jgi:hypothetical protein
MLTDKEMLEIAKKYLKKMEQNKASEFGEENSHELMITKTTKKSLGNVYDFGIKLFSETLDPKYAITYSPFLVEKERRRVLHFGTHYPYEEQYEDYKNGNFVTSLHAFWYPDEDRYSHE